MKTIDKWILGLVLVLAAGFGLVMTRTDNRVEAAEVMAREAKIAAEQALGDRVRITGEDGTQRIFWRAPEESDVQWAHRVRELYRSGGVDLASNYLCGNLTGCSVGNGNIELCIIILPGMTQQQAEQRLQAALDAFCQQFDCDQC